MSAGRIANRAGCLHEWAIRSMKQLLGDWLDPKILHLSREKMIMTLQAGEKLMSLTDVSEMLGIPVHTLYRWRHNGDGPAGYRVGRHVRYRREAVEAWLEQQADKRS
jgi:excisionase family DNA binding protein